jgi:hypothetical protein
MVNNSTNINKTNNHFSQKNNITYDVGDLIPDLDQAQQLGGVKSVVNGIQRPLYNWISKPIHI